MKLKTENKPSWEGERGLIDIHKNFLRISSNNTHPCSFFIVLHSFIFLSSFVKINISTSHYVADEIELLKIYRPRRPYSRRPLTFLRNQMSMTSFHSHSLLTNTISTLVTWLRIVERKFSRKYFVNSFKAQLLTSRRHLAKCEWVSSWNFIIIITTFYAVLESSQRFG